LNTQKHSNQRLKKTWPSDTIHRGVDTEGLGVTQEGNLILGPHGKLIKFYCLEIYCHRFVIVCKIGGTYAGK